MGALPVNYALLTENHGSDGEGPLDEGALTLTDSRTGADYRLDIEHGAIRAAGLGQVRTSSDDPGLAAYDPAFKNTAACISRITYIDGDQGILRYRGYPIDQLAEGSTYLDVAWLVLNGELPTPAESASWRAEVRALQGVFDPLPASSTASPPTATRWRCSSRSSPGWARCTPTRRT